MITNVTKKDTNMLIDLLGSASRAEILKKLFIDDYKSFHLRELARLTNISAPVLSRELHNLVKLGIVVKEEDGNRVNYSANKNSILFSVLCELVIKSESPLDLLKKSFSDYPADFIFIFGSQANGTAKSTSDIDLFVIGDCSLREVVKKLHSLSNNIKEEINPYVISKSEFVNRINQNDHFLKQVSQTKKLFIKGNLDEFNSMVG